MDETIRQTATDLESGGPISESTLRALESLLEYTLRTQDCIDLENFYNELSSRNLSHNSLITSISLQMDSGSSHVSLLASKVYLLLILSPNSPVFTLFTPMAFLSLLRSIRCAFKNTTSTPESGLSSGNSGRRKRGGSRGGQGRNRARKAEDGESGVEARSCDGGALLTVLEKLESVLGVVHLHRFPDCLRSLVQTVAEIPVVAMEFYGSSRNYGKLCELCSRILSEILKAEHGDQGGSAVDILRSLAPLIIMLKSQARNFTLEFVVNSMLRIARTSSEILKAVVNFPKYLVQKAPEKAESRALAVESIMEIVKVLDCDDQIDFADYVVKMSQGKSHLRLLAVDLIPALITSLKFPQASDSSDGMGNSWGLRCLQALIQRCSDATAGIRARALTNLAQLVTCLSENSSSKEIVKELMGYENERSNIVEGKINNILRRRCIDEKAAVRKAAILLVSKMAAVLGSALDGDLLKSVSMACSDPLVSIRKGALTALSEAFRKSSYGSLMKEWLHSVPRLIADNESSIQEECENLFLELIIDRISKAESTFSNQIKFVIQDSDDKAKQLYTKLEALFPEGVLSILNEICDSNVAPWVKKICTSLGKKKKLKPSIAFALQSIIRTSESMWLNHNMPIKKWIAPPGAWFLLSEVSEFLAKSVDWEFLHHHWQLLDNQEADPTYRGQLGQESLDGEVLNNRGPNSVAWAGDRVFLLQTISKVSVELPPEPAADLAHNLLKRLEEFNMHPTEVNAHVKALRTLCQRKALNPEEADSLVTKWVHQLLAKASRIIEKYISNCLDANRESTFLTPPCTITGKGKRTAGCSSLESEAINAIHTVGCSVIICPSADVNPFVSLLQTIITSGRSDPKSSRLPKPTLSMKEIAPSLYIQAWLTMGKICLVDAKLAKRYIPLFVQELEKSDIAALRNNIVVMMADFCVRYTALIDCYMPAITKCLRDPCEVVRRQTFILLSRLLQRDYVKWRGVLFLRFLLSLDDESEKIRELADFLFGSILKVKAPLLAYNSFVEAIYVLNDCNVHSGSSNTESSKNENRLFCIRGNDEKSRSRRMHIYITLLKQMAPEHLLATFAKVCAEILAAASDGMLNLEDTAGKSVLQDAFGILSSKEIRISSFRQSSSEATDMEEEGGESVGVSVAAARGRTITQAVKKGLIQNTIPIFIELKRLLENKNSPLTGSLMECLRVLLKDYRNEIDDILVADKQLQKELIYDMQKYEAMKAKSAAAETVATMQRSETYLSPGVSRGTSTNNLKNKVSESLRNNSKAASAMADAVAAATARSVLREVNQNVSTPPLSAMSVPKLKSRSGGTASAGVKASEVLESLRRRQSFDSDNES